MTQATYVRTTDVPLSELRPYPGNARRGHVPGILESLCRNGQYRGIIVRSHDEQLTILAGNHTTQAIAAHGPGDCGLTVKVGDEEYPCALCGNGDWSPTVRCEIVTCSDDTARRINLVDNKASEDGTYDQEALAALLGNLGDDYTGTGYADTDLDDLLTAIDEAAQDEPELLDDTPPPASSPGTAGTGEGGHGHLIFTYAPKERDEAAQIIAAVKAGNYPDADDSTVVLYALRALAAVLQYAGTPEERLPVGDLLTAAQGAS